MEFIAANMAPLMFGSLVLFMLFGYPVAFALAANGIVFGLIGIELGRLTPALFQALPDRIFGVMSNDTLPMANDLPDGKLIENETLSRHLSFPSNPMFKGVWKTRLSEKEVDAAIDETIAWFKEQNAPFFFWWTGGGTTPKDLEKRLAQRGLLSMAEQTQELAKGILSTEQGSPCMVAELSKMNETILAKTPPGFAINEVENETQLYDFKNVFVETYAIPEWAGQAWVDATLKIGIGQSRWRMFVGYLNGSPVATNMLFNGAGVASVARKRVGIARLELKHWEATILKNTTMTKCTIGIWTLIFCLIAVGCKKERPAPIDPQSPAGVNMALQALQLPLAEAMKTNNLQFIHDEMDYILRLAENLPYRLEGEKKQRVEDLLLKLKIITEATDNSSGRKQQEATAANLKKLLETLKELDAEFATTAGKK